MPETSSETQSAECDACGHRLLKRVLTARDYRTGAGGVFDVWRCRSCGLASIQPQPNWLELQPHYPDWLWEDEIVATSSLRERKQASFDRRFRHAISALEKAHAPGRLLDVGCATGEFMATAAAHGWSVEGLEVPGRQVDVARARGFSVIATGDFPRQSFEHR